jgi:hypothetical protein
MYQSSSIRVVGVHQVVEVAVEPKEPPLQFGKRHRLAAAGRIDEGAAVRGERAFRHQPSAICVAAFDKGPVLGQEIAALSQAERTGPGLDDISDRPVEILARPPDIDLLEPFPRFRFRDKSGRVQHGRNQIAKGIALLNLRLYLGTRHELSPLESQLSAPPPGTARWDGGPAPRAQAPLACPPHIMFAICSQ